MEGFSSILKKVWEASCREKNPLQSITDKFNANHTFGTFS